jgi:hypothetical protein
LRCPDSKVYTKYHRKVMDEGRGLKIPKVVQQSTIAGLLSTAITNTF